MRGALARKRTSAAGQLVIFGVLKLEICGDEKRPKKLKKLEKSYVSFYLSLIKHARAD